MIMMRLDIGIELHKVNTIFRNTKHFETSLNCMIEVSKGYDC